MAPLREACSGVLIVTYKEDTRELIAAMSREGLAAEEVKGPYTDEQLAYSAVMQALVNHANAWRAAPALDYLVQWIYRNGATWDPAQQR